jgi:hypothetical protein
MRHRKPAKMPLWQICLVLILLGTFFILSLIFNPPGSGHSKGGGSHHHSK